jgi:hypothetical protein
LNFFGDLIRAVPFKYTWEGRTPFISDPPTPPIANKNVQPPPPEFTSINTPLPPEKKS